METRYHILERLEYCIQKKYGTRYVISIFGSTAYSLDSDTTDLDVCLVDTHTPRGGLPDDSINGSPYNLINLAYRCLALAGFSVQRIVRGADTPIIILHDPTSQIPLDINVNCLAGNYNTLFISNHVHQSPTFFLPLANLLKIWARNRRLSSSPGLLRSESITSYTLTLLLLTYLVRIKAVYDLLEPPSPASGWINTVVTVQKGTKTATDDEEHPRVDRWPHSFAARGSEELESYGMTETLEGFFVFLGGWEPTAGTEMMSLRLGGLVPRTSTRQPPCFLQVEDPFILDRNTSGSFSESAGRLFFDEARRASRILSEGGTISGVIQP